MRVSGIISNDSFVLALRRANEMEGKRQFRPRWLGIAILMGGAMVGSTAFGVEFKSGENVTVGPNEVVEDDLYMTGDTMTVEGRVIGDVVAAGRMVIIEGVIEGDLIAVGQAIVIRGRVLGSRDSCSRACSRWFE